MGMSAGLGGSGAWRRITYPAAAIRIPARNGRRHAQLLICSGVNSSIISVPTPEPIRNPRLAPTPIQLVAKARLRGGACSNTKVIEHVYSPPTEIP